MIGVLDYGAGNLFSVGNALKHLGFSFRVVAEPPDLRLVDALIFPGVGNFRAAAARLRSAGLWEELHDFIGRRKAPFLGICLGMQLLFSESDEGPAAGLGIFPERVEKFTGGKVPLIGWNKVFQNGDSRLFKGLPNPVFCYFVHSFRVTESGASTAGSSYLGNYVAAVERDNVCGVQFHPEKSGPRGLRILENWCLHAGA